MPANARAYWNCVNLEMLIRLCRCAIQAGIGNESWLKSSHEIVPERHRFSIWAFAGGVLWGVASLVCLRASGQHASKISLFIDGDGSGVLNSGC